MKREAGPRRDSVEVLPKVPEANLGTLWDDWGAAKRGRGTQQHATYLISLESYTVNTGSFLEDVKGSGE